MSDKKESMRGNSELFDWMLAIDFDPVSNCLRKLRSKRKKTSTKIAFLLDPSFSNLVAINMGKGGHTRASYPHST